MKRIAVTSLKGGVGKTTIAAALALNLVDRKYALGAVDCDVTNPSMHLLLDAPLTQLKLTSDYGYEPANLGPLYFASIGGMYTSSPVVNRVPSVNRARDVRSILGGLRWPESLEAVLYDTPPTSSEECQAILESGVEGVIIVTEGGPLAQASLPRSLDFLKLHRAPLLAIVVNRYHDGQELDWGLLRKAPDVFQVPDFGDEAFCRYWPRLSPMVDVVLTGKPKQVRNSMLREARQWAVRHLAE